MARIVVLSFDDNDAAEHFVSSILEAQDEDRNSEYFGHEAMAIGAVVIAMSKVEAVVARPTVSCRCRIVGMTEWARLNNQRKKTRGMGKFQDGPQREEYVASIGQWHKTERFGWLIHTKCNRPNYFVVHRFIQNMLIGLGCNNLLDEIKEKINGSNAPTIPAGGDGMAEPNPAEGVSVQSTELPAPASTEVPSHTGG